MVALFAWYLGMQMHRWAMMLISYAPPELQRKYLVGLLKEAQGHVRDAMEEGK